MIPIRDTIPSRTVPVVTWSLIAANVAVFLFELTLGPRDLEALVYLFGVVPVQLLGLAFTPVREIYSP